jgi:hypothetical protein
VTMAALPSRRPLPGVDCALVAGCVMIHCSVWVAARREAHTLIGRTKLPPAAESFAPVASVKPAARA